MEQRKNTYEFDPSKNLTDKLSDVLKLLEARAVEIETPPKVTMPEAAKITEWHCASRSAGIRDAIDIIKQKLNLKKEG